MSRSPTLRRPGSSLRRLISDTSHRARLVRGMGGTFAVRVGNLALKFITSFLLARMLGTAGYGVYNFVLSWVMLLIVPALFGVERLLVREIAIYRRQEAWGRVRGLLDYTSRLVLRLSIVLVIGAALFAWLTYHWTGRPALLRAGQSDLADLALVTLWIGLLLLPVRAFLLQQQNAMQGLRHVLTSQFPEQVLQPVLFLAVLGAAYGLGLRSAPGAMALHVASAGVALIVSIRLLQRIVPGRVRTAPPDYAVPLWVASMIPFAINRGLLMVNVQIDSVLLGALSGPEDVALFNVVQRGSQLVPLGLMATNIALGPVIAQAFADGTLPSLQRTVIQSARLATAGAVPLVIAFALWGETFLRLWGNAFAAGQTALMLASLGELVNAMTGPAIVLLMMTRHERQATAGFAVSVALHIVLDLLLIPRWGLNGAAVALGISVMLWNVILVVVVWQRLRLHTTAFGTFSWMRRAPRQSQP